MQVEQFYLSLFRNRKRLLVCFLLVGCFCAILGARVNFSENLLDLLPSDHELVSDYRLVLEHFNPLEMMSISVSAKKDGPIFEKDDLIAIGDTIYDELMASNFFRKLTYKIDVEESTKVIEVMFSHRAALFSEDDQIAAERLLKPAQLEESISGWKKLLTSTPAPMLSQIFYDDPLGLSKGLFKRLESLQSFGSSLEVYKGRLFSKSTNSLIMVAHPNAPGTDTVYAQKLVGLMNKITTALDQQNVQLSYVSGHRFAEKNATLIRNDVEFATGLSLVGIILLAMATFRRRLIPILTLVPLAFGSALAFACVPLISSHMSLIAVACGGMLFGVAVDYGIHILFHLDHHEEFSAHTVARTMQTIFKPLVMSSVTTIVAFLCLYVSVLPSYRDFSIFGIIGLFGSLVCAMFVLPIITLYFRRSSSTPWIDLAKMFYGWERALRHSKKPLFILILAISAMSLFGLPRVKFDGDLQNLYATDASIEHDVKRINEALGNAMSTSSVVAAGDDLQEALLDNDRLALKLSSLQHTNQVQSVNSIADFLPSLSTQKQNIVRWQRFWNNDRKANLRKDLQSVGIKLKLRPEFLEHVLALIESEELPLTAEDYQGTPIQFYLDSHLSLSKNRTYVLTTLKLQDTTTFDAVRLELKENRPHLVMLNARHFIENIVALIYSEMQRIGMATIFAVILVLVVFYGVRAAIPMVVPLLLSLVWSFGFMGLFGIPVNLLNCVVSLFVFGLVIDYSVFLASAILDEQQSQDHLARSFGSIFMSAITTIIGVGTLAMADHPALKTISVTILIGIICGLFAITLVLLLIAKPTPNNIT